MSNPIVVIVCTGSLLNGGSLNSAHMHGTDVPMEEQSTASNTDSTAIPGTGPYACPVPKRGQPMIEMGPLRWR